MFKFDILTYDIDIIRYIMRLFGHITRGAILHSHPFKTYHELLDFNVKPIFFGIRIALQSGLSYYGILSFFNSLAFFGFFIKFLFVADYATVLNEFFKDYFGVFSFVY